MEYSTNFNGKKTEKENSYTDVLMLGDNFILSLDKTMNTHYEENNWVVFCTNKNIFSHKAQPGILNIK